MENTILPLSELQAGEKAEVIEIYCGRGHWENQNRGGFGRHGHGHYGQGNIHAHGPFGSEGSDYFQRLGIHKGSIVEMVGGFAHGPVTVAIGDNRIALGRGLAMKVMVKKV